MKYKYVFIFYFIAHVLFGSEPADSLKKMRTRKIVFGSASGAAAAGSLVYLNQAWYKPYKTSGFHFFNDGGEWLQMDKVGHGFTTYQVGRLMMHSMQWAGFTERQSVFIGGTSGLAYMTAIEVLDGFSDGWGFSWGDMGANTAGSACFIAQQLLWKEQRVSIKFSFHQTNLPQYRPNLLGNNLGEQILKDYNGQCYWLSFNVYSFLKKESRFPKWLNLAFGYGANNMIGGDPYVYVASDGRVVGNDRYRRYLLSLDIDLTRLPARSKFLKGLFSALNCLKIPFPAIEFNKSGVGGHLLYF